MSKKRYVCKSQGFSLVELMVTIGILGGLSLVITQMIGTTTKSTKELEASSEITTILSTANKILLDHDACGNTFGGVDLSSETTIPNIRNVVDNIVYSQGTLYGNRAVRLIELNVVDITLNNVPAPSTERYGTFNLEMVFEKESMLIDSISNISKNILIQVRTNNANEVLSCHSHESNAIETAMIQSCEALEGTFNLTTEKCELSPYRIPNQRLNSMAISEEYIDEMLNIVSGGASTLTIGDSPASDELILNTQVTANGLITANEGITIADTKELTMASDEDLKMNIKEIEGVLDIISELRGVHFEWKKNGKRAVGLIAQDIQKHYPELVKRSPRGHLTVDYLSFNAVLLKGIKELNQERLRTKEELDDVYKRLQVLETHIKKMNQVDIKEKE